MKKKIIRITTIPTSISSLLHGQLKFMSQYFDILGVASSGQNNELSMVSKLEGIPTHPVELTRQITPIKDLKSVWNLYKLLKKEKPFIVHSHTPKAGTIAMLAGKLAGVPHRLHTIAGLPLLEATGNKRRLLNTVEKITYRSATMIYPNSFGLKDIILKNKFTREHKLKVIANGSSNGIDTTYFNPKLFKNREQNNSLRKNLNIKPHDFVYVFIGRIVADKGINELVWAFNEMTKTNSKIKLLLVGGQENDLDPIAPTTLNMIESNKNIICTGWVDDVRPYMAISNCLTFPSYREGFPNVVMQAGAMELACIVTDINGCNEIINHKETGLIIPVKDKEALFNDMWYVLNNIDESRSMGVKCREYIMSNFERKVVWEALLDEYNSLK